MREASWGRCRPPVDIDADRQLRTTVTRPADLGGVRARLRDIVLDATAGAGSDEATDDVERVLLVVEELASNGLRHGDPPVEVLLGTTESGWLLAVSDTAGDRPPRLAVDRDPAYGGMGLYLVARLASAHGWTVRDGRKVVWALVERLSAPRGTRSVPA